MASELMLMPVLAELTAAGVKDENVTVIFGCGTHRAVKPEEAAELIGTEALKRVKTISHCGSASDLVFIGTTKTHGNKVNVNRVLAEADVKVLLGDVGFHFYAGYGGEEVSCQQCAVTKPSSKTTPFCCIRAPERVF